MLTLALFLRLHITAQLYFVRKTTGTPGPVLLIWSKNTILKFVGNTE